jgi:hypothetical protein
MSRRSLCALVFVTIFLISFVALSPASAADYTKIGVKQGDVAEYSEVSDTEPYTRIVVRVVSIASPFIELNLTCYVGATPTYSRQQNYNFSKWVDYRFLIAANLTEHDQCYSDPWRETINFTEDMLFLGVSRTVLHVKYTHGPYLELYWDKATGLLVKANYMTSPQWINLTLTSTTAFATGGPPSLLVVGGAIAAVVVIACVAIYLARRGKK